MTFVNAYYRSVLYEYFPSLADKWRRKFISGKQAATSRQAVNIDQFLEKSARGHVLVVLSQAAWFGAIQAGPSLKFFNIKGLTLEVVKAFNELGYLVDIVDWNSPGGALPRNSYAAVFAHGPYCKGIIEALPPETVVIHYASGAYWKEFNKMSQERYEAFAARNSLPVARDFIRSLSGTEDGEEYLARRANHTFLSGPRTVATFEGICQDMTLLYLGSYVDNSLRDIDRDYEAGRKNFIYVAGSGGNIQKGMDILIEAFSQTPDLHLYIYCLLEDEVLAAYKDKLALPNIHYIYHLRFSIFKKALLRKLALINFSVTAPIDTGPGTAMLGSIGIGLIPVGYADIEGTDQDSCLTSDWKIPAIITCVRAASEKSAQWCERASRLNLEKYEKLHKPEVFGANFKQYVAGILKG